MGNPSFRWQSQTIFAPMTGIPATIRPAIANVVLTLQKSMLRIIKRNLSHGIRTTPGRPCSIQYERMWDSTSRTLVKKQNNCAHTHHPSCHCPINCLWTQLAPHEAPTPSKRHHQGQSICIYLSLSHAHTLQMTRKSKNIYIYTQMAFANKNDDPQYA